MKTVTHRRPARQLVTRTGFPNAYAARRSIPRPDDPIAPRRNPPSPTERSTAHRHGREIDGCGGRRLTRSGSATTGSQGRWDDDPEEVERVAAKSCVPRSAVTVGGLRWSSVSITPARPVRSLLCREGYADRSTSSPRFCSRAALRTRCAAAMSWAAIPTDLYNVI
jgi:hypothetical protein